MRTARVFLTASSRAQVVGTAILHALGTPRRAHVVGESEGVLGHVWLLVVAAEAAVGQGFSIAVVDEGFSDTGLAADGRTGASLVVAPGLPCRQWDAIWVNIVVGGSGGGGDGDRDSKSQEGCSERDHCD